MECLGGTVPLCGQGLCSQTKNIGILVEKVSVVTQIEWCGQDFTYTRYLLGNEFTKV